MMGEVLTTLVELACHRSNIRCRVDIRLQARVAQNLCPHLHKHIPDTPPPLVLDNLEILERCLLAASLPWAMMDVGRPHQGLLYMAMTHAILRKGTQGT
jgi:hypothetical protein